MKYSSPVPGQIWFGFTLGVAGTPVTVIDEVALPQFRSFVVKAGTAPERVKILGEAMAKVAATDEYRKFLHDQYAADDSFIPAGRAGAYLETQLADMRAALAKKS